MRPIHWVTGIALIHNVNPFRRDCVPVAAKIPLIPLDAFHVCVFHRHRPLEIAYTGISLVYGTPESPYVYSRSY